MHLNMISVIDENRLKLMMMMSRRIICVIHSILLVNGKNTDASPHRRIMENKCARWSYHCVNNSRRREWNKRRRYEVAMRQAAQQPKEGYVYILWRVSIYPYEANTPKYWCFNAFEDLSFRKHTLPL